MTLVMLKNVNLLEDYGKALKHVILSINRSCVKKSSTTLKILKKYSKVAMVFCYFINVSFSFNILRHDAKFTVKWKSKRENFAICIVVYR